MADVLEHFTAARPPRGQETCACCEGDGVHGTRACARCDGTGFVRKGSDDPFCPGREDDRPVPARRHWREGARRDPWHGEGPWYHGTPEELAEGDVIQPGDVVGKQHMGRGSDSTRAWVTNDPWKASSYGTNIYEVEPSVRPKSMYARHHEHYLPEGGTARVIRQVPYAEATELSPEYQRGKRAMEKQIRQQRRGVLAGRPQYGPRPEYRGPPEGAGEDEQMAHFERARAERNAWSAHVKRGLSLGHLSAEQAKGLNYYFGGHETDARGEPGWQPLPREMYHATTDLPSVRAHGLKTRDELGQLSGHGLGGGESDTISVTTDHELGRGILASLHEFHDVVNGRYTPQQMWADARAGRGASRPFHEDMASYWHREGWHEGDEMPIGLHNAIHGIERKHTMGSTQERMDAEHGPGWRPARDDEGWMSGHTPPQRVHLDWERPMTPDEHRGNAADFYKKFSAFREHAGGREDPNFFMTDEKAFAAKDPRNFALLHVRPAPGGHGYPMGGMREWRTGTGDALQVHHYEQQHDQGRLRTAVFRHEAREQDYGIGHEPDTGGPPLHDLLDSSGTDWGMPPDIYDNLHQYNYGEGNTGWDAMAKIRKFRGQPDKRVRIWRSAPAVNPESRNNKRGEINHGDWIALSKEKALRESYEVNDPPRGSLPADHPNRYHIWSALVPARHVRNADGDITEWGYSGPDLKDLPHSSERCSHRARVLPEGTERPERVPRRRSFWDTDFAGKGHFGAYVPRAERTENVAHMLAHYQPTDFGTWAEVDHNFNWDVPENREFVEDVRRNGVRRPIPVDYESDPPRVMNGHRRLLSAHRAGVGTVPTRQHEGFADPDDPDPMGCHGDWGEHEQSWGQHEGTRQVTAVKIYDKRPSEEEARALVGRRIDKSDLRYSRDRYGMAEGEKFADHFGLVPIVSMTSSMATDRPYGNMHWGVTVKGQPAGRIWSNFEGTRHRFTPGWWDPEKEVYDPERHGTDIETGHQPRQAAREPGMRNPHTGGDEFYHGTKAYPEELGGHGFADPMEMDSGAYEMPESETEGTHWNALLGTHFTADHDIAKGFAAGDFQSSANQRGEGAGGRGEARSIIHARLGLRNPKVYRSEHDMDHEAYEHEWKAGNHPSAHIPVGSNDEDERAEMEEMWNTADRLHRQYRNRMIPAGHDEGGHPARTAWINSHPDKWGIANRYRERLKAQGHDGIIYGNEYERSKHGGQADKSAIVFDPGRIQVTQQHGAYEDCMSGEEGEHQQRRVPGPGQMELRYGAWVPGERIFGPTYGLDHRLFGADEQLRPAVRDAIMSRLGAVLGNVIGPDWHAVVTPWLAGSQVSKWTSPQLEGNGDLDVLVGLSHSHVRLVAPALAQLADEEIEHRLNTVLRERFNIDGWHPPFDPDGSYDLTGYAIHAADIRQVNPYAAYNLSDDKWTVRPPDLPQWSAQDFPQGPALMHQARALIAEVRAILRLPEPFRRQEAERIWRYIHEGRAQSFTPGGLGWQGTGNVLEKALDQASGALVGKLKAVIYGPDDGHPHALAQGLTTADVEPAHA